MKALGWILAGSLALALLKAAIQAMAVAIMLGVVVGFWHQPLETLGLLGLTALATAFSAHPAWTMIAVVSLSGISLIQKNSEGAA